MVMLIPITYLHNHNFSNIANKQTQKILNPSLWNNLGTHTSMYYLVDVIFNEQIKTMHWQMVIVMQTAQK